MINNHEQHPSDFSLSRYILGESSDEERKKIDTWLSQSPEAPGILDRFRADIEREETYAPPLLQSQSRCGVSDIRFLSPFKTIKGVKLALSGAALVLCVSFVSLHIHRTAGTRQYVKDHMDKQTFNPGFRDTLEALLRITSQNQMAAVSVSLACDWVLLSDIKTNPIRSQSEGVKADRTLAYE